MCYLIPFFHIHSFYYFPLVLLEEHYFPAIVDARDGPEEDVIFIDGHGSRIIPKVWSHALDMPIHTQFLPSHTSTETQMLDVGFNAFYKQLLKKYFTMPENPTAASTRTGFVC
jgi:hypothetical protein